MPKHLRPCGWCGALVKGACDCPGARAARVRQAERLEQERAARQPSERVQAALKQALAPENRAQTTRDLFG